MDQEKNDLAALAALAAATAMPQEGGSTPVPGANDMDYPLLPKSCMAINATQPDGSAGTPREAFLIANGNNGVILTCLPNDNHSTFSYILGELGNVSNDTALNATATPASEVGVKGCLTACATMCDWDASCELAFYDYQTGECVGFIGDDGLVPTELSDITLFDCTQDPIRFCSRDLPTFSSRRIRHVWNLYNQEETWLTTVCPFRKVGAFCDPCRIGTQLTPFIELFPEPDSRTDKGLYCKKADPLADSLDENGRQFMTCYESRPLAHRPRCDPLSPKAQNTVTEKRFAAPPGRGGWVFPWYDKGYCNNNTLRVQAGLDLELKEYLAELAQQPINRTTNSSVPPSVQKSEPSMAAASGLHSVSPFFGSRPSSPFFDFSAY